MRRTLRTVSPRSFGDDPLRIVRGLRFVSQLGLEPDEHTLEQMREHADSVRLVSGERIGGGISADGLGELSKLLLGARPAKALRLARDTGVLVALIPEFAPAIGFFAKQTEHSLTVDEHTFAVVQAAADAGDPLRVRLATVFHDLGKPSGAEDHAAAGAQVADAVMRRLRYPTELRREVVELVRIHPYRLEAGDALEARRLLAAHGDRLVADLLAHWQADVTGRDQTPKTAAKLERIARFGELVAAERRSPHRLGDLAVDGRDLIALGYREGPELGRTLRILLDEVVEEPSRNEREALLARARELLA
jgi:tRNA nucleotidyltransferase (CCA-adding enzyme)